MGVWWCRPRGSPGLFPSERVSTHRVTYEFTAFGKVLDVAQCGPSVTPEPADIE